MLNIRVHRPNNKYANCAIKCVKYVAKIVIEVMRRICSFKLNELLWICIVLMFVFLIVIWDNKPEEKHISSDGQVTLLKHENFNLEDFATSPVQSSSQNPVIVWWTSGFPYISETTIHCSKDIRCDVYSHKNRPVDVGAYLFYASGINFDKLPLPRNPEKIIWGLTHEESPRNVLELMHEKALNLFNFSSTFSRHSDVPYPLQYVESLENITSKRYFIETSQKNSFLDKIASVMYLQSDCETSTERDAYVEKLMELIPIDSYGACLNNKVLPRKLTDDYLNKLNDEEFLRFIARYKFVISIENGVCDDYVTEKFWRPIAVGTVPIYFGSPIIRDWMPNNKSAILLTDFPTPKILSEHLKKLMHNDKLYEEYLEHKTKGVIRNLKLINELRSRPYQSDILKTGEIFQCLICKKLHKRKEKSEVNIVNKGHYNCPKPISALTLGVNPSNDWVHQWESSKRRAEEIHKKVMNK